MRTASTTNEPLPPVGEISGVSGHLTVQHRRLPSVHGPTDRHESATWYEEDFGRGWRVAYRLVRQGDAIVLGEARIFPADDRCVRIPGEWSGDPAAVPRGGMTDAVTKALRTEIPIERAREVFAHLTGGRGGESASLEFIRPLSSRGGGRPQWRDDRGLAEFAAVYARHVSEGNRAATRAAAAECHYSPRYASKLVAKARERELLTPAHPGKAAGELTDQARRLLSPAA